MTPTATFIDQLWDDFNERHSWLSKAGEQCRKWREEDRAIALTRTAATREPSQVSQSRPSGRVSDYRKEGGE